MCFFFKNEFYGKLRQKTRNQFKAKNLIYTYVHKFIRTKRK